jgi:lysozyme
MDLKQVYADLKRDEGRRDRPYRDSVGVLSIGYGHNLEAKGLCEAALIAQLEYDVDSVILDLYKELPWWKDQPPQVQRVLINLAFNLGIGGLKTFVNTLALIKAGKYSEAADHLMDSLYARQVGQRADRLATILRSI